MLSHPFVHDALFRERIARLLSAPRPRRPGPEVDGSRPSEPAVTAAAGAGPPQ